MDVLAKRVDCRWNLGAGEPIVVNQVLRRFDREILLHGSLYFAPGLYPRIGGETRLVDSVKRWMESSGYRVPEHVVVTAGAKQALAALIYNRLAAYRKLASQKKTVTHLGPYWPTLKSIVTVAGGKLKAVDVIKKDLDIITSPNNPNGLQESFGRAHIWDGAYASPAYGWNGLAPRADATVFSMAKLFGVPGIRVGWIATDDQEIAEQAATYVEVQTSGVANESQSRADAILRTFTNKNLYWLFCQGVNNILERNRRTLTHGWAEYVDSFPAAVGMYLYCWPRRGLPMVKRDAFHAALQKAGVAYVPGTACGQEDIFYGSQRGASKYCYRFNLAQPEHVVIGACNAVLEAME